MPQGNETPPTHNNRSRGFGHNRLCWSDSRCCRKWQPCGVQVVEWVGLVASGFQFLLANQLKSYKKLTMATHGAYFFS
jgi:hypothetical protein